MEQKAVRQITVDEFEYMSFPEEFDVELINGRVVCKAKANGVHQKVSANLTEVLNSFLRSNKKNCVLFPEIDVVFNDFNKEAPDIVVLCDIAKYDKGEGKKIIGAPELVIEMISPSTRSNDENEKLHVYINSGVKEYWIVNPYNDTVSIYYSAEDGRGYNMRLYKRDETVESSILDGINLKLDSIFDDDLQMVKEIFLKHNKV